MAWRASNGASCSRTTTRGLRRLIGTTLGTDHFELLQAVDGEEALRIARQQHPELVLLDVNMPKLDGFEVCRQLKTEPETCGHQSRHAVRPRRGHRPRPGSRSRRRRLLHQALQPDPAAQQGLRAARVTLATFLQPGWLVALLAWNFAVLAAAQLTIRLIMAFSVRLTLRGGGRADAGCAADRG